MPSYKNNKYYGGLICMIPPINMLAYLLLPFYLGIKNKAKLEKFNRVVCMALYFPIGLIVTAFFLASSLVMVPFAYLKVVLHKVLLANKQGRHASFYGQALFYTVLGLPILLITSLVDSVWFFRHLYYWNVTKVQEMNRYPKISLRSFNKFLDTVNQYEGVTCNAKELVLKLRNQFKTTECIFGVLYANKTEFVESRLDQSSCSDRRSSR